MNLRDLFPEVSGSAFRVLDGETRIVGKHGQISLMENGWFDVWIVGPDLEPVPYRRLAHIQKSFPVEAHLQVLTGEAYTQVPDRETVLQALPLLGIKRKRKISLATKRRLQERMAAPGRGGAEPLKEAA